MATSDSKPLRLNVEGSREVADPIEADLMRVVDSLTPFPGPNFFRLEASSGNYLEAAGGAGFFTAACRESRDGSFRHYVARSKSSQPGFTTISSAGHGLKVRANSCLGADDVKAIVLAFARRQKRSANYGWREIT